MVNVDKLIVFAIAFNLLMAIAYFSDDGVGNYFDNDRIPSDYQPPRLDCDIDNDGVTDTGCTSAEGSTAAQDITSVAQIGGKQNNWFQRVLGIHSPNPDVIPQDGLYILSLQWNGIIITMWIFFDVLAAMAVIKAIRGNA